MLSNSVTLTCKIRAEKQEQKKIAKFAVQNAKGTVLLEKILSAGGAILFDSHLCWLSSICMPVCLHDH